MDRTIELAGSNNLILSAEDLCLLSHSEISRLHRYLSQHFDRVRAICYVRDHLDYAQSAIQQRVKMGFSYDSIMAEANQEKNENSAILAIQPIVEYRETLINWLNIFGKDCLLVKSYEKTKENPNYVIDSLLAEMHIERERGKLQAPPRLNVSISAKALAILDQISSFNPLIIDEIPSTIFVVNILQFVSAIDGPKLKGLPKSIYRRAVAMRAKDDHFWPTLNEGTNIKAELSISDERRIYGGDENPLTQLDNDIARSMYLAAFRNQNSVAREKFFAALLGAKDHGWKPRYISMINDCLFLMTDPDFLNSSAKWLKRNGRPHEANRFAHKAETCSKHLSIVA